MAEKKTAPAVNGPKPEFMKIANEIRSSATSMSDVRREDAFSYGMRLIYGGSSPVAAKVSRP